MPVSVINSNLTTSNSTTSTPNKPPLAFSATDFQKWNQTTSVVYLPAKLIGKDKIPKVRGELVKSIGEKKVAAVQALSPTKYRVQFSSSSYRHERDVNGIDFRGVTLTPHPAYEEVKSVFVDRAPPQMPDSYLFDLLAPYGRVLGVEHLKVKGFQNVKSGTRRVSMVIAKSIPSVLRISNIQLSFRYRGQPPFCFVCQEVGHTGRDCPKSRKAQRNTLNADLSPEDLRHKLNHVKEGDLRVKLHKSQNVNQAVPAGTAATSPPSLKLADTSNVNSSLTTLLSSSNSNNNNNTHPSGNNNNNNNVNNDQPERTIPETTTSSSSSPSSPTLTDNISKLKKVFNIDMDRKATSAAAVQSTASMPKSASSSCSAQSSQDLRATISTLKKVFGQHSEIDRTAESEAGPSFESLARETQSAAAQSTASVCKGASNRGFLVKLNGQVLTAKSKQAVPQAESFGFSLKPARSSFSSSAATTSAWSNSYKQAIGIRLSGCKGRDTSESDDDSDYDLPLAKRFRKSLERKSTPSSVSKMEEDSVEECLHGTSVVDPIVPEQLSAADVSPTAATTTTPTQEAPAATQQPNQAAMSSPARVDDDNVSVKTASTPASLLGTIDFSSPASSDELFALLTAAAPVLADSTDSASRLASVPPGAELLSDPAGQDRVRELMLELPTLDLE